MNVSISLHILLAICGAVAFLVPLFIKEKGGDYLRGMNVFLWMLACWPAGLILFVWAIVEAVK